MKQRNSSRQKDTNTKSSKPGIRYGTIMLAGGLIITLINGAMIYNSNQYFPKLFVTGGWITLFSLVFFVFPGGTISGKPAKEKMGKALWQTAPVSHKIAWVAWALISGCVAFYGLIQFDPDFWK